MPINYRALALGVFAAGTYIGVAVGMWGGALLETKFGWRDTFRILALPGIFLSILVWFTLPRAQINQKSQDNIAMRDVILFFWKIRSLRLIAIGSGMTFIFGYASSIWMPSYFMRSHGMTLTEAGFWNGTLSALGGFIGSITAGLLVSQLARKDVRYQMWVPAIGFLLAFLVFAVQLLWPASTVSPLNKETIPSVAIFSLPAAFLMGLWMPPAFAAIQNLAPPPMRSQATALFIVILFMLGGIVGPIASGAISDYLLPRFGAEALRMSLLTLSATLLAGSWCYWRAASYYPQELQGKVGCLLPALDESD